MELKVYRKIYSKKSTIGELFINDVFFCYTLEDFCRDDNKDGDLNDHGEDKVHGQTCIPLGRYRVVISFSNRFKKYMPEVLEVPGFKGIRIHNGNKAEHTEGCLLVGSSKSVDFVGSSKLTFKKLMSKLQAIDKREKIFIEYIDRQIN